MIGDETKLKWGGAAALIPFASAAHAQSSVTLYAVIDSGLFYQSANAANFQSKVNLGHVFQLKDGGIYSSIWGLKGSEDIGGGYKVNFKLQGAFNSSNGRTGLADALGATAVFNQQTTGMSGPFGSIDAGRQIVPVIYAMADTDVRSAQYFGSILTGWLGLNQAAGWQGFSTNGPVGALYDDNAIVYRSPKFYGASLALEYAPGGTLRRHARIGCAAVFELWPEPRRGVLQRARHQSVHADRPLDHHYGAFNRPEQQPVLLRGRAIHVPRLLRLVLVQPGRNPANKSGPRGFTLEMFSGGLRYKFSPAFKVAKPRWQAWRF